MTTTLHVDEKLHAKMRAIADAEGRSIGEVIADTIARYERETFWRGVHADFVRLREDPAAWRAYQAETALWDAATDDMLADEEPYYTPDEEAEIRAELARAAGR